MLTLLKTGKLPNNLAYPLGLGCGTVCVTIVIIQQCPNQKTIVHRGVNDPHTVNLRRCRLCYSTGHAVLWPGCSLAFWPVLGCRYPQAQKILGQLIVTKESVGALFWHWQLYPLHVVFISK